MALFAQWTWNCAQLPNLVTRTGVAVLCLLASSFAVPVDAQEVVFLIRHAERNYGAGGGLLEEGHQRAEAWADLFADADLDVIITSEMLRTQQTGQPISERLETPAVVVSR